MGEISDALRRAREAARDRMPVQSPPPRRPSGAEAMLAEAPEPTVRPGTPIEISDEEAGEWAARLVLLHPRGALAEQYRHAAIRLRRAMADRGGTRVAITSAQRGEGKTTTSCNLAFAISSLQGGRRTALVELDMRRPCHGEVLGFAPATGFERVLAGDAALADARHTCQFEGLDLYPIGETPESALELLASPRLAASLAELGRLYDLVIVDTPPVLPVPDLPLVLPSIDGVMFVARAGMTRTGAMRAALEMIEGNEIVGMFVNDAQRTGNARYYGYNQNPYDDQESAE